MEKFSLFPSFMPNRPMEAEQFTQGEQLLASPRQSENDEKNAQDTPFIPQKTGFFTTDEECDVNSQTQNGFCQSEQKMRRPNAMLDIISAHSRIAERIKRK